MKDNLNKSFNILGVNSDFLNIRKSEIIDFSGKKRILNINIEKEKFLEKGLLNEFSFQNLTIKKTGKEIKEKLQQILIESEIEKNLIQTNIISLLSKISQLPTEKPDEWLYSGLKIEDKTQLPKLYSYTLIWGEIKTLSSNTDLIANRNPLVTPEQKIDLTEGEKLLAQQYNKNIEKYLSCLKEINYMKTFLHNLRDNDKYDLSIEQATIFGF